jgi:hypothetical protein
MTGGSPAMSVGAAKSGDFKFVPLLWDVMDQLAYKPTAAIYEDTIVAFAASDNLENAFAAMASMEAEGFPLSRALIRSFIMMGSANPSGVLCSFSLEELLDEVPVTTPAALEVAFLMPFAVFLSMLALLELDFFFFKTTLCI